MARLRSRSRDAGRRRHSRCSATSPTRSSPTPASRRRSRDATASSSSTPTAPTASCADFEIKYTFGVHPLQQYLIELPGGRMQALSIAWDSRPEGAGRATLVPPLSRPEHQGGRLAALDRRRPELELHLRRVPLDQPAQELRRRRRTPTRRRGPSSTSSCEACHGPGSNHVAWARKQGDWKALDATKGLARGARRAQGRVMDAGRRDAATAHRSAPRASSREIDTCARCHGRAARISDDYVHGKSPLDTHRLALLDDNLYWNDGQMRDEVYNWGSFAQSRMHAQGVTCSDCHDPHSLKLKAPGNAVCAQCHQPAKFDQPSHTHHAAGHARRRVRRVPHADHDVHGGRSAARSFDAGSAPRSVGEARRAERLQRLPHEADRAMGGRCDRRNGTARRPPATSNSPRRCGRIHGCAGCARQAADAHRRQDATGDRARQRHRAARPLDDAVDVARP